MKGNNTLAISNLTRQYSNLLANNDVGFEVQLGEIAVSVGPNGADKSTATKCVVGLLRFYESILVCGVPSKKMEARCVFGYVPELSALLPLLAVWEHIKLTPRAYQLQDWRERTEALLDRMELTGRKEKLGQELSKGTQQKLNLCCMLLPWPKVIMLDEPLVGLNPHAIKGLKTVLTELRDQGCTVLAGTHILDSVAEFWDKALIMKPGKIVMIHTCTEIEESGGDLEQLFFSITENGDGGTTERNPSAA